MPVRICLNSIVRNEASRIIRCLNSVLPIISSYVICDTGSTDHTPEIIDNYFAAHKIPGRVTNASFVDWSQARNAALADARRWAPADTEYLLLCDADMELRVLDATAFDGLTGLAYDIFQQVGALVYQNRRLLRFDAVDKQYIGVTHEFLNAETAGCLPREKVIFFDHADGANRPDKFKRDIRLLEEGLKTEPNNERYYFYLAQSYRDAGDFKAAAEWYKKRVDAGGWDEERWCAQLNYAHCLNAQGDEAGFIKEALVAYNMRPSRAESLYDLANHCRIKGLNAPAVCFAEAGLQIPRSNDALFVNEYAYGVGPLEEISICGYYIPGKRDKAFQISDHLSVTPGPFPMPRHVARNNMYWYLRPLEAYCPSFRWHKLNFTAPEHYTAMNPSVTAHHDALHAIIRTVNYRMDEEGRYLINATDGTANDSNPIHTRSFLTRLDHDLQPMNGGEIIPPPYEPLYPLVRSFEDMRLFSWRGELWSSSTVRDMNPEGYCEQVLARIEHNKLVDIKRMLREPRVYEKNWAPIVQSMRPTIPDDSELLFMYRPGEVIDSDGKIVAKHETNLTVDRFSGSSQVIRFNGEWLELLHEAQSLPDKEHKRYYYHRFAIYDDEFKLLRLSNPFYFNDKVIEFANGMAMHPDGSKLVISYGFMDAEARIATVEVDELRKLLCATPELKS